MYVMTPSTILCMTYANYLDKWVSRGQKVTKYVVCLKYGVPTCNRLKESVIWPTNVLTLENSYFRYRLTKLKRLSFSIL